MDKRNPGKLAGKVALITGGGGGIGGATARLFAREGASVAAVDIDERAARKVAAEITKAGGKAIALQADVADPEAVERVVKATVAAFKKLHVLVNVAAARDVKRGTVVDLDLADWNRTLAVNITGPFLMCKYAIPHMKKVGGASIINVASQLGIIGVPSRIHYCSSKAALIHFSKVLAMDHAKDKIRVNALSPGAVDTPNAMKTYKTRANSIRIRGPQY
jgi:NAD(P)-dependent dehydrogenase (short-subunit alcohol dehydrogenase family)